MAARSHMNPAVSAEQYRLAQAVLSGTVRGPSHMSVSVAREIVERTPARLRSEYNRNPFYGTDLDLETTMAPAWMYYGSKEERDNAARMYEGRGKKVVLGHSMFGFKEGGGKKWRLRGVDHRGNPQREYKTEASFKKALAKATAYGSLVHWYGTDHGWMIVTKKMLKGNPQSSADDMYASFHGEPTDETIEYQSEEHYHSHLAALGELVELKVKLVGGGTAIIGFETGEEESDSVDNPFWSSARSTASRISGSVLSGLKRAAASRKERARWIPYTTTDSEMRAQAKAGYLEAHDVSAKVEKRKVGGVFSRKYKFDVMVDREQLREMFKRSASEKKASRGSRSGGSKPAGAYKGYQIREVEGGFAVPKLDPEGVFTSKADAKEFIDYSKMGAKIKNPGGPLDTHVAKELELYVENDADLYRQQYTPINKNLVTKLAKGVYNHNKAVKLFGYLMESGAKKYAKEYSVGTDWHQIFSPATRKHVAELFTTHFETEANLGNYDNLLPKKYADWRKKNPGPFHEAGKLLGRGRKAVSRPMDQFIGAAGKVGGYLDDELGRALNPRKAYPQEGGRKEFEPDENKMIAAVKKPANRNIRSMARFQKAAHDWGLYRLTSVIDQWMRETGTSQYEIEKYWPKSNPENTGPVYLTSNEDGTQLYITGGDQSLDLPGLGITGPAADKELVTVGSVTNICYHAHKIFDGKREEYDYVHKFSEDSHGPLPILTYDRINQQLKLSGGVYKIERPLVGTSPGIED